MRSLRHLREARKRVLDAAIRAAQRRAQRVGPRVVAAFQYLLAIVQARTGLLSPSRVATDRSRVLVEALLAMAVHRWDWQRPLQAWTPPTSSPLPSSGDLDVFASLAEHLFASYPVPRFMLNAWLGGVTTAARREQRWYIRLGAGESVRALDFPLPMSRSMAHAFRDAPVDLSVLAALRWAQVRALDGTRELARAVALTRLGREAVDEAFFAHVIAFLVAQETRCHLDAPLVDRLVEFFHERRAAEAFTSLTGVWPASTHPHDDVALCALGPKTRDRILDDWGGRAHRSTQRRPSGFSWKASPFGGLVWFRLDGTDARLRTWRIRELCSSEALREEGIAMRHCVATYASKCASNPDASIWSMTVEDNGQRLRAVTIEVNAKRREVCQVKGPANKAPKKRALEVLRRWAEEQGLALSSRLA